MILFSYTMDHWLIGTFVLLVHDFTDLTLIFARGYRVILFYYWRNIDIVHKKYYRYFMYRLSYHGYFVESSYSHMHLFTVLTRVFFRYYCQKWKPFYLQFTNKQCFSLHCSCQECWSLLKGCKYSGLITFYVPTSQLACHQRLPVITTIERVLLNK